MVDDLIDTHCHLDAAEFDADRAERVASAHGAGVTAWVVPAVERANFGAVASVCREFPAAVPAYGIHPLYVGRAHRDDLSALAETLSHGDAVAVGEIGLDAFDPHDQASQARQEEFFIAQLELARRFDLPVLLHVRRAVDRVLHCLRRHRVRGGIAHAFNGSRQQAEAFIQLGFKLGFGGAMSFPGSRRIRTLAAELPLDTIVLETDAPDMPPVWLARARNTPEELPRIAGVLAELRSLPLDAVAMATAANARAVISGIKNRLPTDQ